MSMQPEPSDRGRLLALPESDRARLSEALQTLLAHGSILGLEPGEAELYAWCRQNFEWLKELAALLGLEVFVEHADRIIQAVPGSPALTLHLRQDATLVLLALWYEFDTQVRDQGATRVTLTVEHLNRLLRERLLPELKGQPSADSMKTILRQARRFNLVRYEAADPFEETRIEVLPTLKRVIQFDGIEEWTRSAQLHRAPLSLPVEGAVPDGDDASSGEEEVP